MNTNITITNVGQCGCGTTAPVSVIGEITLCRKCLNDQAKKLTQVLCEYEEKGPEKYCKDFDLLSEYRVLSFLAKKHFGNGRFSFKVDHDLLPRITITVPPGRWTVDKFIDNKEVFNTATMAKELKQSDMFNWFVQIRWEHH